MRKDFPTIDHSAAASAAAKAMIEARRGFIIVLKDGSPKGIVTENDFVSKIVAPALDASRITVAEILSSPLITIDPDEDLLKASELMQQHHFRRLPVARDGIIYGVITTQEIAQHVGEYVDRSIKDIMRWASPFWPDNGE
jgi:CBS domain-containing protein